METATPPQSLPRPVVVALLLIRFGTASVFLVHGLARWALDIVTPFAGFFAAHGFPAPGVWPWVVTIVEIVGGALLAAGWFVRPLSIWFAIQILAGIITIHAKAGWFVVGAGRNGMEYSVLILVCLAAVFIAAPSLSPFRWPRRKS
jgi:putative oxidoreductase